MPPLFEPQGAQPLGRKEPESFRHLSLFSLTAPTAPAKPVPVVFGVDWHTAFDRPVLRSGKWWLPDVAKGEPLGSIRGGHAICGKPDSMTDLTGWWEFYEQGTGKWPGTRGGCVGMSGSRCKTLLERARFDPQWLYWETQKIDWWVGGEYPSAPTHMEGTSVSTMFDVLRTVGHKTPKGSIANPNFGVTANRWARSLDDIRDALKSPRHDQLEAIPLLNSWGRLGYPHITYLPYATATELCFNRGGECAIPTDR